MNFRDQRVTIMGLGRFGGGLAAARWLAQQGARVTISDKAGEVKLADSLAALRNVPIAQFHLEGHREEDILGADLVVVNPAVKPDHPLLCLAQKHDVRLTSEIELFLRACPASVVGVTGSNGKSTTAAMAATLLEADGRRTWLGGNIGRSLLGDLDQIGPSDAVVLELSSFQLFHLSADTPLPQVVVVTGCSPNHLDWHQHYGHYVAAKQRILTGQTADGLAVLNTHDSVASWNNLIQGRMVELIDLAEIPPLCVPGKHNRINAACAATAVAGLGCEMDVIQRALGSFSGLPQRLQRVRVVRDRSFHNDSTATTPESTVAALRALKSPIWLLAGGRAKGCEIEELAQAIVQYARGAAFFGEVGDSLHHRVAAEDGGFRCTTTETMDDALDWCWERSQPGDAIVLSPGFASTDQFGSFCSRGDEFVRLVEGLI